MGLLVRQHRDPDVTPETSTNAGGRFHWSGLHESVRAACDGVLILDFCRSEGRNMGWNDALYDRVFRTEELRGPGASGNLFHPELLGGYPHEEFARSYERGVQQFRESGCAAKRTCDGAKK